MSITPFELLASTKGSMYMSCICFSQRVWYFAIILYVNISNPLKTLRRCICLDNVNKNTCSRVLLPLSTARLQRSWRVELWYWIYYYSCLFREVGIRRGNLKKRYCLAKKVNFLARLGFYHFQVFFQIEDFNRTWNADKRRPKLTRLWNLFLQDKFTVPVSLSSTYPQ